VDPNRHIYVHLARGALTVNGHALQEGDGLKITGESLLELADGQQAEALVFDVP
jgi:redox-sensitive bicupin YhaK (pirin superfamily)